LVILLAFLAFSRRPQQHPCSLSAPAAFLAGSASSSSLQHNNNKNVPATAAALEDTAAITSTATTATLTVPTAWGPLECVPVTVRGLPVIGQVTIVEATAASQELLVDRALLEDDHDNNNSDDIYGAVLWPAASALAARLLRAMHDHPKDNDANHHPQLITRILEVGAGTGLVSLAAARGGAAHVLATDYQPLPLQLLRYAAEHLNHETRIVEENDPDDDNSAATTSRLLDRLDTAHLDLNLYETQPLPSGDFDILVAADVLYAPATGVAVAHRAVEALRRGMRVWIADSPGRAGRPAFEAELARLLGLDVVKFETVAGSTVTGPRHELICGPGSPSVSAVPRELAVDILELDPAIHGPAAAAAAGTVNGTRTR